MLADGVIMYKYKIVKKKYGYVVINETLNTHAHLPNYKGCAILLHLIKTNQEIEDKYLRNAKDRLIPPKREKKKRRGCKGYKNVPERCRL